MKVETMKVSILAKLMMSFFVVGIVPLVIVGIISLKDAKKIGYGAAKDAETLGEEAVADTNTAITKLVGDSFLKLSIQISQNIQNALVERENDALSLSRMISDQTKDVLKMKQTLLAFSARRASWWYNSGTDEMPIEKRMMLPLYSEITYINRSGMEVVKVVDGTLETKLRNVSDPANTTFKTETYFKQTKSLSEGKIYVSRLNTWYLSQEEARKDAPPDSKKWNTVRGRDTMKHGNIRFGAPVFVNNIFDGIILLSMDYRHLQTWTKHVDPANERPVVSTSYEGNYILMYDDNGDTVVHPKPNNIRGYIEDGTIQHSNTVATPGGIFNLKQFDKSPTYREIYDATIGQGKSLVKSAVDVQGRNKMTISLPIPYDKGEYGESGFFGGIMLSVNTDRFYETARNTEKKISARIAATNQRIKLSTEGMQTQNTILAVTLITILVVIILGIFTATTISKPIRELTRVANTISEGNVDVEIPDIKTQDEIYELAESLRAVLAAVDFFREELDMNTEK